MKLLDPELDERIRAWRKEGQAIKEEIKTRYLAPVDEVRGNRTTKILVVILIVLAAISLKNVLS